MTLVKELHKKWMKQEGYAEAYEYSRVEYELASAIIQARIASGLTQEQLADRMHTSQSAIARLESGSKLPSMKTLTKFAQATDSEIKIQFARNNSALKKAHA
jgi:transcriptional regulator with XRE-family HTH domain